ncbi:UDP-glucose 6-dehydrogenase [Bacillus sp. UMB0899]|uniref:UDP-glucose dehydrogenase family protein n=1 Tax=Metabacillus schmidteae TaxID=2730405 RepID=UPI000C7FD708|nr:UDP-glucose/GDP-mannose dehydrogenase family protein [Metabacillus schmidteae]PMC36592.1 UDP-glucose 6-dehydrogenase [Bacillus sp. UMB0899]
MKITVAGTGYVGLVTGICLAEVGHDVICIDIDHAKINTLKSGKSPIYEPGLEELLQKNLTIGKLTFTTDPKQAYLNTNIIIVAVGTPENNDGSANLTYIENVCRKIAVNIDQDIIIITKSTVPVGTNDRLYEIINNTKPDCLKINVVSNPEFLREGSAIKDMFHGDRIVIGASDPNVARIVEEMYRPFNIPVLHTDIKSAEMIKYASNAFLATKISFINEIASICEKVGANIEDVANGIGKDKRIGDKFLQAGIGYGGSCFPKDTKALVQIAGNVKHKFELLESVIRVNNQQQTKLFAKAKSDIGNFTGKKVAILGASFKPNTDDIRESASLIMIDELVKNDADVHVYDPIALENLSKVFGDKITYCLTYQDALKAANIAFLLTEWEQIKMIPLSVYVDLMEEAILYDGRNCYSINAAEKFPLNYISIGRKSIYHLKLLDISD